MKTITFTARGISVDIIARTITGYTRYGVEKTFISTGADGADGGENGWIVDQSFEEVRETIKAFEYD